MNWWLYVLECEGGRLYAGISTDVEKRFQKHLSGKGAKYTRANKPLKILARWEYADRSEASKAEWAFKQLHASQKIKLIQSESLTNPHTSLTL